MRHISEHLKIDINSLKKTFARLKQKEIISSNKARLGRNGCVQYKLSEEIYRDVSISKNTNHKNNLTQLIEDKRVTTFNTSSSSIYNNTTTSLPEGWSNINFEELKEYGFNEKQIIQISKLDSVTPEDLQESINHFVFDLQENNKADEIKKSPIAFFMGIMRGQGIYIAPKNYESLQDRKLRLKLEQEKAKQQKRDKMEAELMDVEYKNWISGITIDEKNKIMPEEVKNSRFDAERESFLKQYFKDNHWMNIQQEKYSDYF